MRTGIANLPLHGGKAPRWLFERMTKLAREISIAIVTEDGPVGLLNKLSDPYWFQAFGCVLGFDWHSSGLTTTVCGALKEGVRGLEQDIGFFAAGGKGSTSRKTPSEIESSGGLLSVDPKKLIYSSRMSAKVDSAGLQDGYQLYHHSFFYTKDGDWAVVQQGMNGFTKFARRYHWLGRSAAPLAGSNSFVSDPHAAVCCDTKARVLNMVTEKSREARIVSTELSWERPEKLSREIGRLKALSLPARHHVELKDVDPKRLHKIFLSTYERRPKDFETLLGLQGVGAKTIRALSLIAELLYGVKSSVEDPVRYSFAHGGKDGFPFPVDRATYDCSIEFLRSAVSRARLGITDRTGALKRLARFDSAKTKSSGNR